MVAGKEISVNGWKPIETAPRDGTLVDLWFANEGETWRVTDCAWHDNAFLDKGAWMTPRDGVIIAPVGLPWIQPTHWMPMPSGPA